MSIINLLSEEKRKEYEKQAIKCGSVLKEIARRIREENGNNNQ